MYIRMNLVSPLGSFGFLKNNKGRPFVKWVNAYGVEEKVKSKCWAVTAQINTLVLATDGADLLLVIIKGLIYEI